MQIRQPKSIGNGALSIRAAGNISQAANTALAAGGPASFNAVNGAINLTNNNALAGTIGLTNSGGNVALSNNQSVNLGNVSVGSGNLSVTAINGNISRVANTHLTVNGASLRTGDVYASGTVSGPERDQRGSFLELSWGGREPLQLPSGRTLTFLEDGDEVTITAWATGADGVRLPTATGVPLPLAGRG